MPLGQFRIEFTMVSLQNFCGNTKGLDIVAWLSEVVPIPHLVGIHLPFKTTDVAPNVRGAGCRT